MANEIDRSLLEKTIDLAGSALRGSLGGEGSQPPGYAAELFRAVWDAVKQAASELPERSRPGF